MKNKSLFLCLITTIILVGCTTVGNEKMKNQTQSSIQQQITEGKTTKTEIQSLLGNAANVSFTDAGNEIWTYRYSRATPQAINFIPVVSLFTRGADVTTKELVVMFDKNNLVSKYTLREVTDVVKSGLAH